MILFVSPKLQVKSFVGLVRNIVYFAVIEVGGIN